MRESWIFGKRYRRVAAAASRAYAD